MLLKNIEKVAYDTSNARDENDLMADIRYISKSCSLITESLQKGCDVMQMPNGDIIVSEIKTITLQYTWDQKKGKLVRTQLGHKQKKTRLKKAENSFSPFEVESNITSDVGIKETA